MPSAIEYRSFAAEFRTDLDAPGFSGYASHFWSADSYSTAMAPGAFKKSLRERGDRIPVLWSHNPETPVGKHRSIKEDKTGLAVDVELVDDNADGSVLLSRLRGGIPLGLSFGFNTVKDRTAEDDDPIDLSQLPSAKRSDIRVITEARLWETSVVVFPANEQATISAVRSEIEFDALSQLLDAIKEDRLDVGQIALCAELVAAWGERAEAAAVAQHSTPEQARRNRIGQFNALLYECGMVQEMVT